MIISQTPFRVSFAGGGTDLPAFYEQDYGAVLSVTLRRHMYVTIHDRFERNIRVSYSKTETVQSPAEVGHDLVREALQLTKILGQVEITTIADVPAGTGMGSSSSLTVGLLNAMYAYKGQVSSAEALAAQACSIEIDKLGNPIGRQDQYAAAFGGLNYIRFNPDHSVLVEPVPCEAESLRSLEDHALIVYTAQQRSAGDILSKQSEGTADKRGILSEMRDLAAEMRDALSGSTDLTAFAGLLHQGWELKRSLGFGISNQQVDDWYGAARKAGAWGGKLLGAGGAGFLFLLAPRERHDAIRESLGHPQELPFAVDPAGSRIIFISRES